MVSAPDRTGYSQRVTGEVELSDFHSIRRTAHVMLRRTGGTLEVTVNGNPLIFRNSSKEDLSSRLKIPANTVFSYLEFFGAVKEGDVRPYITNLRIAPL